MNFPISIIRDQAVLTPLCLSYVSCKMYFVSGAQKVNFVDKVQQDFVSRSIVFFNVAILSKSRLISSSSLFKAQLFSNNMIHWFY